jgi:hypothetical protein
VVGVRLGVRVFSGNLPLLGTYARTVAAYTVSYAFLYGYTQWLEDGRGLTASVAGLMLLLVLGGGYAMWLLLVVSSLLALPQGLISLANQNALYRQAQPERMGASAGLLRTFMYLGAMTASSATGLFFGQRATTHGLHNLALFALAASAIVLAVTLLDRSLRRAPAPAP